ncbi:hypothetical protein, partial [uncultured Microbulbifer sp.]|uniref:hypothetical protein n=1 Tax=uncultured Microbulbifer sp. TaxID=348147 RepID=UPI0026019300
MMTPAFGQLVQLVMEGSAGRVDISQHQEKNTHALLSAVRERTIPDLHRKRYMNHIILLALTDWHDAPSINFG